MNKEQIVEPLQKGSWGNYMAIHFLQMLNGGRKIDHPKDIGIDKDELPRLIKQAEQYEKDLALLSKNIKEWDNMDNTTKLFRVTLKGMITSPYHIIYVIATDPTTAYNKVRSFLDSKKYGFDKDREMDKIELIAEDYDYTKTGSVLFI